MLRSGTNGDEQSIDRCVTFYNVDYTRTHARTNERISTTVLRSIILFDANNEIENRDDLSISQ